MTQQKEDTIIPSPHQKTKRREGIDQEKNLHYQRSGVY